MPLSKLKCRDINCYCCHCCHTLVIADYSLGTFCPGRPHCSVGLRWWVKARGLGWRDTRHASSVFKTLCWQVVASHRRGPTGCRSGANYGRLGVSMIYFFNWFYVSFMKHDPLNVALPRCPLEVSSSIMSSSGWVDACVYGKDTGRINMQHYQRGVLLSSCQTASLLPDLDLWELKHASSCWVKQVCDATNWLKDWFLPLWLPPNHLNFTEADAVMARRSPWQRIF